MNATNKHQHYGDVGLISDSGGVDRINGRAMGSRALWKCCATDRVHRMGCRIGAVEAWRRPRFIPADQTGTGVQDFTVIVTALIIGQ